VANIISVFNNLTVTTGNLFSGTDNDIPANAYDFESVALHEMGHALGLAHPNLANESRLGGLDTEYTKSTRGANHDYDLDRGTDGVIGSADDIRGDDVNLHWFSRLDNDPFILDTTIDTTTYSHDLYDLPPGHSYAANANRDVAELLGYADTEAVMNQGSYNDEVQRTLVADDVATLRLACAGLDETAGTADDYTIRLVYAGRTTKADIVLAFNDAETGFAVTALNGVYLNDTHFSITRAHTYFNTGYNWYFNQVPAGNTKPEIVGQVPNPLSTSGDTPLLITLDNLLVIDPDNAYPEDFSLNVYDGADYTRDGDTITPDEGISGRLSVPVTVSDGIDESDPFYLDVDVYGVFYVEPAGVCGGNTPCYDTLQAAIDDAAAGTSTEVRVAAATYSESPAFDADAGITFVGGWPADFSSPPAGGSTIDPRPGAVTFSRGQTVVSGLLIQ
jgi:hypothetical protein